MKITVFTPTYNRASLLKKVYESLKLQNYNDFEWLVIDDGSTDNTKDLIFDLQAKSSFKIEYFKQKNSGKHIAINKAFELAKGEILIILDSDDYLGTNALEFFRDEYKKIIGKDDILGICVTISNVDGVLFQGSLEKKELVCTPLDLIYKYKFGADVCDSFWTEKIKKYRFPEISNEKFCRESLLWNRISKDYKFKYINKEKIYFAKYLEGGLSHNTWRRMIASPRYSMLCFADLLKFEIPEKDKKEKANLYWEIALSAKHISWVEKLCGIPFYWTLFVIKEKSTYFLKKKFNKKIN